MNRRPAAAAVGLVVINAAVAIAIVLFGGFGELQARILGTSVTVTCSTFAVLINASGVGTRIGDVARRVGLVLSLLAGGLIVALIWDGDWQWNVMQWVLSVVTVAVGASVIGVTDTISAGERDRLLADVAAGLGWVLTGVVVGFIWIEPDSTAPLRLFTAGVVAYAALVLILLVRARASGRGADTSPPPGQGLVAAVREAAGRRGLKLAVAESMTAGAVMAALGGESGASGFLRGGVVAYDIDAKVSLLGVDRDEAEAVDCVSEQVAVRMAQGVRERFDADLGLSVTGWAEPDASHLVPYPRAAVAVASSDHFGCEWIVGPGESREAMIRHVVEEALRFVLASIDDDPGTFDPGPGTGHASP